MSSTELSSTRQAVVTDDGSYKLRVSRYDQVAGMLLSLVILIGLIVLILFIVWLSNQLFVMQTAVPVVMEEIGTGDGSLGDGTDFETPNQSELDMEEMPLEETLAAVSDAVSDVAAMLDNPTMGEARDGRNSSGGDGRGTGSGRKGRRRQWEVQFPKRNTLREYAQQLDFFGIELGVLLPGNKVAYAFHLSKRVPDKRTGPADQEKRYYLTWHRGDLQKADRDLLSRAGIDSAGKLILKFLPPKLEAELVAMARARAGAEADNIRKTRFALRPEGKGYKFYVLTQSYR